MEGSTPEKEGQPKKRRWNLSPRDRAKAKAKAQRKSKVHGREKIKAWVQQEEEERMEFEKAGKKKV